MRNNVQSTGVSERQQQKRIHDKELHSITMRSRADSNAVRSRRRKDDDLGSAWANLKASISALF